MDAINIATVVGPNLVPIVEIIDPYEYLQNNAKIHSVLVYLISNFEEFFLVGPQCECVEEKEGGWEGGRRGK
jgi:hypothetical protein